ncbi:TniQ family protein [Janibacter limosus]|uniref:TniQ family protein n=2 Tax=Janibacter limosus TaxID=53458 RepID=A0AC61U2J9_9MICO|nr:TniQ family protein [Janibacter limosus]UUZ44266.1 TniQ family protein [Janibacter limosus]
MRRWPLHPPPREGEALSSRVTRLAKPYGMTVEELLRHDVAPPGIDTTVLTRAAVDSDPPAAVLLGLAEHAGVPLGDIRRMTIAGQVPRLLDTLGPEPEPGVGFETYVHQDSLLWATGQRDRRPVPGWRAWLPITGPMRRACPLCVATAPFFTLASQLPLTLSCPEHGCHLAPTLGAAGTFLGWEEANTHTTPASAAVRAMDVRTHRGLSTGTVTLPRRAVHVGVWFRLLRTLIDELSTPVSKLDAHSRRAIEHIWHSTGHPVRAGIVGARRPYEDPARPHQQKFLKTAATAVHLIETGEIAAHGTLAPLLTPEPSVPADTRAAPGPDAEGQGCAARGDRPRPRRPGSRPEAPERPHRSDR